MDAADQIKIIRKHIKQSIKTVSVTMGKGTAYGWIDIYPVGQDRMFTTDEASALGSLGIKAAGSNWAVISPDDRRALAARLSN